MSKLCPNCGQVLDDDAKTCAFCKHDINEEIKEEPKIEDVLEVPSIEDITPKVEEQTSEIEAQPSVDETNQVEGESLKVEDQTSVVETQSNVENANQTVESTPNIEATKIEDIVLISLDDVQPLEAENVVENNSLETVSVDATNEKLEEKEEVIAVPELPEAIVGEINPDLLGNKYDAEEKINNEKLEAKKKKIEEDRERKRLEEAEKQKIPMEKPDLLARTPDPGENELDLKNKKKGGKKMKKIMNFILIILAIAVILAAVWYFFINKKEPESSYMDPIEAYFTGYDESDTSKILSSFVPCVSKTDEITNLITTTVNDRAQYGKLSLEFKEKNTEVVNADDQLVLDKYLKDMCGTNLPTVSEYKHVYIEEKIKTEEEKEFTQNNPEFWIVKIDGKWYILLIQ